MRLPRVSGDGPPFVPWALLEHWAAPRERGWALYTVQQIRAAYGCPA